MSEKRPVGLVVGETAELPLSFREKHSIEEALFDVYFLEDEDRDKARKDFFQKMRKGWHPKTAQPSVGTYLRAYKKALKNFEEIIVITMTSELSGAFDSANRAVGHLEEDEQKRASVFDSRLVSIGEGLFCWKTQELIDQGLSAERIRAALYSLKDEIQLFGLLKNVRWLEEGGRISPSKAKAAKMAQKLGGFTAVTIEHGKVEKAGALGMKFSSKGMVPAVLKELEKVTITKSVEGNLMQVAITHADIETRELEELKNGLAHLGIRALFVSQITPVLGTYAGPGAILVAYI
ncbi:DegV family EDD domain-containing protein [Patescibacteria group bacterium]|nr:DegV family EDD domain-containing protein [Patescibacteria group bacterium]